MKFRDILPGRALLGRMERGEDLLDRFHDLAAGAQIRLGSIQAIGALEEARLAVYLQDKKEYVTIEIKEPSEVTSLLGNISLKDGRIFCHLHAALSLEDGRTLGGHVLQGCRIFALEFAVREWIGEGFHRTLDSDTGLSLWNL